MSARVRCLAVLLLLLLAAGPAGAVVPSTMGYQGLLTDGGGNPLPSGTHALAFTIYKLPSGGAPVWTESHASVPVTNGGFSVVLGSVNSLSAVPFDKPYWLSISVDGGAELSPRIELASSPYALGLRTPFTAISNDTLPLIKVENTSNYPSMQVDPWLKVSDDGGFGGILTLNASDGNRTVQLLGGFGPWGGGGAGISVVGPGNVVPASLKQNNSGDGTTGLLVIRGGGDGSRYANLDGENGGTGDPKLYINGSASQFVVDTNKSGNASVALPDNSVGPSEMFGEPGLSQGNGGNVATPLFPPPTNPTSVISTTITTPTSGYVTVDGSAQTIFFGTTGTNSAVYQISQSATGPLETNYARIVGADVWPNTNTQYGTAYTVRTYFLAAGTYTFHLIASKSGAAGSAFMIIPTIRAAFMPSSYGTVTTAVAPGEETQFESVQTLSGTSFDGRPTVTKLGDLRDLELRATRARLDAERSERELAAAREEAMMSGLRERVATAGTPSGVAGAAR